MRGESVLRYLGFILLFQGFFLLLSFIISAVQLETSTVPLLFSLISAVVFGAMFVLFTHPTEEVNFSEGLLTVVLGWVVTCLVGALPYLLWGVEFDLVNAWFESVSGFTTTGSTILNDVERLPSGLLFFRSSTHWMGGVGIIMFVLLILPQSSSKLVLLNTELSSLSQTNFKQSKRQVLLVLGYVYLGLTVLQTCLLWVAGMSLFDAVNHAFATIATGGFSTKNLSIAHFNSLPIEVITEVFMVLSAIHFGLLFTTIMWHKRNIFTSEITRAFLLVVAIGITIVALKLYADGLYSLGTSFRHAAFQVISLGTTTGFATVDTAHWPPLAMMVLMYFTIQCGMVGSTSGGLKFDRVYIFFKALKTQILQILHPRLVRVAKVDGQRIPVEIIEHTQVFIVMYILIFFVTTVVLSAYNIDLLTAFSASIATIGNVGPGFEGVSSLGNFSGLPDGAKVLLSINMLFGRLEIFNILALIYYTRY
ncbi:TrkH family potassium uptake protein [Imperialibacter roseus]|uniref:TrkH family potassium uptake protein n=1 Tax=Imperialibacter roseus TaxID=1324217 RepID=A0ABZ0IML2_9BACT|nr:TrkH family potassium uptake protein [Imperialibacter roseus]WOK04807.1 TrkH family potassium uptake protein [Imperialibacter roseus]|tara:strand:+ start:24034 stop:25467 length:1434 start_codon:yes stop_codon:yes gene_type:complete